MASTIIADVPAPFTHGNKRLVHGVGLNDWPQTVWAAGKELKSYRTWCSMLKRCYSTIYHTTNPAYRDCTVNGEWHSFVSFERWFTSRYFDNCALDKDILVQGNREYGPNACLLVTQELNNLLTCNESRRGIYPMGVRKNGKNFQAAITKHRYALALGTYDTPLEAHQAWQKARANHIETFPVTDPRIRKALDLRVAQLRDDLLHNRITEKL